MHPIPVPDPEASICQVRIDQQVFHGVDRRHRQAVLGGIGLDLLLGLGGQVVDDQVRGDLRAPEVQLAVACLRQPPTQVHATDVVGDRPAVRLHPAQQGIEAALAEDAHLETNLDQPVPALHVDGQVQPLRRIRSRLAAELAAARRVAAGIGREARRIHQRPDHTRLRRDIQMLSAAGAFALEQCDDRVCRGLRPRVERRLGHGTHRQRGAVGVALQVDQPAGSFDRHLRRGAGGQWSAETERRHRNMDQLRECLGQIAPPSRLDEHVRVAEERRQVVGHDAALARPDARPVKGFFTVERADVTGVAALGRLDLEDLGAEFGENSTGQVAPARGRVDDANAGEWRRHARRGLVPMMPSASRSSISASVRCRSWLSTSRLCCPNVGAGRSMSNGSSPRR